MRQPNSQFNVFLDENPYSCGRDCKERKVGCHGSCEKYKKFREWNDKKKAKERLEQEAHNIHYESVVAILKRTRRNGKRVRTKGCRD